MLSRDRWCIYTIYLTIFLFVLVISPLAFSWNSFIFTMLFEKRVIKIVNVFCAELFPQNYAYGSLFLFWLSCCCIISGLKFTLVWIAIVFQVHYHYDIIILHCLDKIGKYYDFSREGWAPFYKIYKHYISGMSLPQHRTSTQLSSAYQHSVVDSLSSDCFQCSTIKRCRVHWSGVHVQAILSSLWLTFRSAADVLRFVAC